MVSPHFVTVTFTAAIALTAIGWGFGYLVGRWFVWWRNRYRVRKWLEAERIWKSGQVYKWLQAELKWKHAQRGCDPCSSELEYRRRNAIPVPIVTPGCRPGMKCFQGCDNCRPKTPADKALRMAQRSIDTITALHGEEVAGYTDMFGEVIVYKQPVDGMGRYRYSEYRDGMFIRSWDEMGRMPPPPIEWEKR